MSYEERASESVLTPDMLKWSDQKILTAEQAKRIAKEADAEIAQLRQRIQDLECEAGAMRAASEDALSGWRYIRMVHGDLAGVGWDRVEKKLTETLQPGAGEKVADRLARLESANARMRELLGDMKTEFEGAKTAQRYMDAGWINGWADAQIARIDELLDESEEPDGK